ncbi:NAD-dependent succinate-semialdehyde dehydrogenase [Streptomyces melanosporofaciens]|uniref:Succinate-semialdehyde dehydrogenase / glutarate-semialdehyde dehydrogenase n=1 Tax=Streptomyces melanosporofaciens TaxID=67327 RepID=A0A1H4KLI2_STRMJ|nr:NAD-dependent succinate-semialdehyde dehydrogenase [Streptomyces melanosporofaciens]SEB59096.1 succinate-semialdehyde dehydrogenase / glutarate-semialdehyde dehydrogenase [Streptomyces melanosporofaciens]
MSAPDRAGLLGPALGYVGGRWTAADDGRTFPVTDPATGQILAEVPRMGARETVRAIQAANAAAPGWRALSSDERGQLLRTWAALLIDNRDQLARLLVREQGKPLPEAAQEVTYAASFLDWFAEEGRRAYGDVIPAGLPGTRMTAVREPVGVGACITPWNFPIAMITRKAAPALAAGCPIVLKPAEQTPLCALAVCALSERAGIPAGVFNVVVGDAEDAPAVGLELTTRPEVRKLSFTGSTTVGSLLMRQAADTIKSVSLELGGNAPFIVFDDADLDVAISAAMAAKFRNAGQTCVSANRFLVADSVYDDFLAALAEHTAALAVGNGLDPGTDVGPLIDQAAIRKIERHIADAVHRGAKVVTGGEPHRLGGTFFQPTVLADCPPNAEICCEETFGPVAAVTRFNDEDEAVRHANKTPYGLAAYFFTRDTRRVWRVSEALETGIVAVNTGAFSSPVAPFGGVKQSGLGREGGREGIGDWMETKYVCHGGIDG